LVLLLMSSIAACTKTKANAGKDGVKVIPVSVVSTSKPDAYINEDGKLTGYDVEVLRAIDELLPQYKLDLQTMEDGSVVEEGTAAQIFSVPKEARTRQFLSKILPPQYFI